MYDDAATIANCTIEENFAETGGAKSANGEYNLVRCYSMHGKTDSYTLVPVVVRGDGYEAEWASNCTLGSGTTRDGEAQGFSEAADQVLRTLDEY